MSAWTSTNPVDRDPHMPQSSQENLRPRLTRQRRLVLEVVRRSHDHPTAAQVYQRVRRHHPGIAYATIYNALRWWVERGEVREFISGHATARYDPCSERHDHALCTRCGRLMDTQARVAPEVLRAVRRRTGLHVLSYQVQFFGICRDCLRRKKARPRTP